MDTEGNLVVSVKRNGENFFPRLKLDLKGMYQQKNLPAVLKTAELMQTRGWKISRQAISGGLGKTTELTGLEGRWQIMEYNPMVVCDTAHNPEGIAAVVDQIKKVPFKQLHMVFGLVCDKDVEMILKLLPENAVYYFTKAAIPRSLNEKTLTEAARKLGLKGTSYPVVKNAFKAARRNAGKNDLVFIGGSTFVVSEIL